MGDVLGSVWPYVAALLPSAGILYLFYVVMRHVVEGDRRERAAQAAWHSQETPSHALPDAQGEHSGAERR